MKQQIPESSESDENVAVSQHSGGRHRFVKSLPASVISEDISTTNALLQLSQILMEIATAIQGGDKTEDTEKKKEIY